MDLVRVAYGASVAAVVLVVGMESEEGFEWEGIRGDMKDV